MAPDPTGAAPREPGGGDGDPTTASFRGDVEQVDESSTSPAPGPSPRRARAAEAASARSAGRRGTKVRARKVHRIVRHIEPWSVLKVSLLFFLALFLIICVASAVLWSGARSSGSVENVEDFITEVGALGKCPTTTTVPPTTSLPPDPATSTTTTVPVTATTVDELDQNRGGCSDDELVGGFKFEDERIFEAFGLGGAVLVLAGSAGAVVMALLFNLISDLTGGVRVTVLEEEPPARAARSGSPGRGRRD